MSRLRWIVGAAAVLGAGVLALPWLISAESFRPILTDRLKAATGQDVRFGTLRLSLLPLSLDVSALQVGKLATAEQAGVRVPLMPLLSGDVVIDSLRLVRPVVDYRAKADRGGDEPLALPEVARLTIEDGTLRYTDAKGKRSEYTHIDADLSSAAGKLSGTVAWRNESMPVSLKFAATQAGTVWNVDPVDVSAGSVTAAFRGKIDMKASTVNGEIALQPTPLDSLPLASGYKVKGSATAAVKVSGALAKPVFSGSARVSNLEVSGGKLAQPLRAAVLDLRFDPRSVVAAPFVVDAGASRIEAAVTVNDYTAPRPSVDAMLSARDASLQSLLVLAGQGGVAATGTATIEVRARGALANPRLSGSGQIRDARLEMGAPTPPVEVAQAAITFAEDGASLRDARIRIAKTQLSGALAIHDFEEPRYDIDLQADRIDTAEVQTWFPASGNKETGSTAAPRVQGQLAVGELRVNGITLTNCRATLRTEGKVVHVRPLTAGLYDGQVNGAAAIDFGPTPARISLETRIDKAEAKDLLQAATPLRNVLSGPFTANANLAFAMDSAEEAVRTLSGTLDLDLAKGQFLPLNLFGEMNALGKFLKPLQPGAGGTPFLGMKGRFQVANGTASTDDLRVELDGAAAQLAGSMNLVNQTLDMRLMTTLQPALSQEVGGTKIGGLLNAALAGPKGELIMPMLLRGSFSKPVITPDAAAIGKAKLAQPQELKQSVKGIFDLFQGKKKAPETAPPPQQP